MTMRKDNATFCAMQGFASLSILEQEAIALLRHGDFYGGYTDFTIALNRPKSQATNVRKALMRLDSLGIILIGRAYATGPIIFFMLPHDYIERICKLYQKQKED